MSEVLHLFESIASNGYWLCSGCAIGEFVQLFRLYRVHLEPQAGVLLVRYSQLVLKFVGVVGYDGSIVCVL